ncbi:Pre-mRNA-splicing factor SPF27 [Xylaria nigripes]|nr:Pre-mRNA-splicing factor SPF27 [Xylaria nigripes]
MASSIHTTVHESLPYIDKDLTPSERKAAQDQIDAELASTANTNDFQPTLPPLRPSSLTPALQIELERIAAGTPLSGIDATRYELQEEAHDSENLPPSLSRAYATATYLSHRKTNLHLLDAYGKNAWLTSNWQAEADLAALERDLTERKREIDLVNIQRRRQQDDVADELRGLEDTWKKGVGRVLEAEIATESLRQQVLERRRGSD